MIDLNIAQHPILEITKWLSNLSTILISCAYLCFFATINTVNILSLFCSRIKVNVYEKNVTLLIVSIIFTIAKTIEIIYFSSI